MRLCVCVCVAGSGRRSQGRYAVESKRSYDHLTGEENRPWHRGNHVSRGPHIQRSESKDGFVAERRQKPQITKQTMTAVEENSIEQAEQKDIENHNLQKHMTAVEEIIIHLEVNGAGEKKSTNEAGNRMHHARGEPWAAMHTGSGGWPKNTERAIIEGDARRWHEGRPTRKSASSHSRLGNWGRSRT